jgi:hypothetical protein
MRKISEVVAEVKRIAKGNDRVYSYAARVALSAMGFPSNTHLCQTIRQTRGLANDENVDEKLTLHRAVMTVLGREGGKQSAINREKHRQMTFQDV